MASKFSRVHGNYGQANVIRNLSKCYILRNDIFNLLTV